MQVIGPGRKALFLGALAVIAASAAGFVAWRQYTADNLPAGIVAANGRVEANEVEIATKLAGRIVEIHPREGDMVEAGGIVARVDEAEIAAALRGAEAEAERTRKSLVAAEAQVRSRKGDLTLADKELRRTSTLVQKGYSTRERLDQRQQAFTLARAGLDVAEAQVDEMRAAIKAADAQVDRLRTQIADAVIRSPVRGRVQHRLIEPGAVLPVGGRIVTLLDLADVSMTIFLSAADAGRLSIGDEARVKLDAAPEYIFPATVSFVAAEAQFTPKTVETSAEREKLMFRVKLKAPPEIVQRLGDRVKSGLRGVAYVRVLREAAWTEAYDPRLPQ